MLKKEQAEQLKELLGLDQDQLKDVLTSEEEKEIKLPTGKFFSDEQLATLKENVGKESAEKGANTIIEMKVKELARAKGFEIENKSIDALLTASEKKAKETYLKEPNEQISTLQADKEALQKTLQSKEQEWNVEKNTLLGQVKEVRNEFLVTSKMPNLDNGINQKHLTAIWKAEGYSIDEENGQNIVKKNGVPLKDDLQNFVPIDKAINGFIESQGFVKPNGRGGDDSGNTPTTFKTMDEVFSHMEKNSINPDSEEGQKLIESFNSKN